MKKALLVVAHVVVGSLVGIWGAFVFTQLWAWFMVSKFGLPPLSIVDAAGVLLVASFATLGTVVAVVGAVKDAQLKDEGDREIAPLARTIGLGLFVYPLALGIGFVWTLFR